MLSPIPYGGELIFASRHWASPSLMSRLHMASSPERRPSPSPADSPKVMSLPALLEFVTSLRRQPLAINGPILHGSGKSQRSDSGRSIWPASGIEVNRCHDTRFNPGDVVGFIHGGLVEYGTCHRNSEVAVFEGLKRCRSKIMSYDMLERKTPGLQVWFVVTGVGPARQR